MKYITAIIQPHRLDRVREALGALGVHGLTASDVYGYGRQKGHTEVYRGAEYEINYVPKIKIEIAVTDEQAEAVLEAVQEAARSGKIGDGKVFVFDLGDALRIRTGEAGTQAL
ncbi:P-II family nitrogen regulator [Pelagibius sp.]|uniref:P-II family nitrogen regulator n=1 Tax=Pelagibius sp. TaxID=1931238 RepID=UPI00263048C0|nr:P-II family nitrogen regulator [Pelagibius sp.]